MLSFAFFKNLKYDYNNTADKKNKYIFPFSQ